MTNEQKQRIVSDAVTAAIHALEMEWEDQCSEGEKTEHFCVTIHNQDTSLFADGGVSLGE